MDFSILQSLNSFKKVLDKNRASEFDAHSFLNKADKLTDQIETYFIGEENDLLNSMHIIDRYNDITVSEMEICATEIMRKL